MKLSIQGILEITYQTFKIQTCNILDTSLIHYQLIKFPNGRHV